MQNNFGTFGDRSIKYEQYVYNNKIKTVISIKSL